MKSDIKIRAKRLATAITDMFGVKVSHSNALELVAKEENYPNWDAASANFDKTLSKSPNLPSKYKLLEKLHTRGIPDQMGFFIAGKPGTGKTFQAYSIAFDSLENGNKVFIFDIGFGYKKFVELMGGTHIVIDENGVVKINEYGKNNLFVFDYPYFNKKGNFKIIGTEHLSIIEKMNINPENNMIIIDETETIDRAYPEVVENIVKIMKNGCSFCVIAQDINFDDITISHSVINLDYKVNESKIKQVKLNLNGNINDVVQEILQIVPSVPISIGSDYYKEMHTKGLHAIIGALQKSTLDCTIKNLINCLTSSISLQNLVKNTLGLEEKSNLQLFINYLTKNTDFNTISDKKLKETFGPISGRLMMTNY
jgi:nucleoside-triphosphatase THEP1